MKQQKIHLQAQGFVLLSEGPPKLFLFIFKKLGDIVRFFVFDLSLLKSCFSAACFVRKAWEKVCEFLIEKSMEKSDLNSF
jgi:hypothetical protein